MKNLLIIFLTTFFCLGCSQNFVDNYHQEQEVKKQQALKIIRPPSTEWWRERWGKHVYVVRGGTYNGFGSGITHDPDCPCFKKK